MIMQKLLGIIGPSAQGLSMFSVIVGAIFTIDCRIMAGTDYSKAVQCYITGLPMMGLGGAFSAGYNTFNPNLRSPNEPNKANKGNGLQRAFRRSDDDK